MSACEGMLVGYLGAVKVLRVGRGGGVAEGLEVAVACCSSGELEEPVYRVSREAVLTDETVDAFCGESSTVSENNFGKIRENMVNANYKDCCLCHMDLWITPRARCYVRVGSGS